ncbi:uncharacterized protein LOC101206878 isoform X1 [Cucumis sativus]|uniref:BAH domain-containing protein n=1 Tax=Cucumis sativus TaxID=3659 RepID=A0A0A0LCX0_CUCSA|nr:uncharacterized protein LOC101206878 isoform X1 [Cucumis sativus]XP_031738691.1 uncharacterized protein LOC101206878 isoform X1 [Cucumis sativus]KGN59633.1 hypothetical protein Csa_001718 [Cucumis sativus]
MHGSGGERWKQRRHMWPVHSNSTAVASELSAPDFFLKDGRKIHVGDCALFKPPLDSPPFIGIIRSLKSDKETNNLRLDVNWLYRPADVKLPKGLSLDAAPNEIFYSFHKDEIPAASLLHPCKVAFLRKGVELPSSISSFVCRRVYDTDNKCLWWLTDRDYINERQEEVDQLLEKTRLEMHGVVQSGGRSPKPLNGSIPAVQPKSGSENISNSPFLTSHVKSKKRERGDQGSEPTKRERLFKVEEGEFGQFRLESTLKNEIAKITDKGGLTDFEGVEKFVKLIQPDSSGKKIDLADRVMLADVIAVTDRFDCLGWFLQLRGLPVLDEWLQEVHKGKICDGNGMKGSDKTVEDFLLALLRALDKLPVNLNALQTCNVGKSVNHLRSHKNSEIQKKARSLVDTWKKRVEAEMDVNDAKSESSRGVSWPSKSAPLEVSQAGSRKAGGSGDDGLKSSTHSNMFKHSQAKFGPAEMVGKSSASPNSMKSSSTMGASSKDYNFKTLIVGNSDLPLTPIKEERSSGSSQSQNNSQSSDHAKTVASSCKEDTRSSNSGSGSVSKVSSGASRHRKSSNGIHLNTHTGTQKISGSGKLNAVNKSLTTEKTSTASHEKSPDVSLEHGYSRLVVKLPNTCKSPVGTTRLVTEDQVVSCHKGSLHDEVGDNREKKAKGRSDLHGASFATEAHSDQCHKKDQFLGSEEGKEVATSNERCRLAEAGEGQSDTTASLTGIISRPGKTFDTSLSSINALIESCVKFSESNASPSPGDVLGMNLLASVATGEISKSNNVSPLDSPQEQSPTAEESSAGNDGQSKLLPEENKCEEVNANGGAGGQSSSDPLGSNNMLHDRNGSHPVSTSADSSRDGRAVAFGCSGDSIKPSNAQQNMKRTPSQCDLKPDAEACNASIASAEEGNAETEETNQRSDQNELGQPRLLKGEGSSLPDSLLEEGAQLCENEKVDQTDGRMADNAVVLKSEVTTATLEVDKQVDEKPSCLSSQLCGGDVQTHGNLNSGCGEEKLSSTPETHANTQDGKTETAVMFPDANSFDAEFKDKISNIVNSENHVNQGSLSDRKDDRAAEDFGRTDGINNCCGRVSTHGESPSMPLPENDQGEKLSIDVPELTGTKDHVTCANSSFSAPRSDSVVKLDFDLNEGCSADEGTQDEIIGSSSSVQLPVIPSFSIPSASESFPVSITVASAAKGSVVPPTNSLANKVELGWKGSAATSAFRRAEPRKNLEMPLSLSDVPLVTTTSKEGRQPLDFDLNVPDQKLLEEVTLSNLPQKESVESGPSDRGGGLDLDLNKVDESHDVGPCSVSKSRLELPMSSRPFVSGGLGNCGFSVSRNFDLNNGPSLDEMGAETVPPGQQNKSYMPFSSLLPGMKVNSGEIGNFYSWFPQGNTYSALTAIPSVLPGRGEQSYVPAAVSQRVFAPPTGTGFAAEIYRAPVLSSSPALAFPPANSFTYSGFPFETSFPIQSNAYSGCSTSYMDSSSGCSPGFPTITSHLLGPAGVAPTPYSRPFIMSYPSGSGTVGPEIGKWGSQGLDLNAGHGIIDKERIDEKLPTGLRQLSAPSSQPFADEQFKMFPIGGTHKRKEPDSGLDGADRFNYKHQ